MVAATILALAGLAAAAVPPAMNPAQSKHVNMWTATSSAQVEAAQATAMTSHPTSHIAGRAFDRFVTIWFENTDYDAAASDPNFAYWAKQGITLSNYYAVAHPSQPNYIASIAGDNFGMDNDDFTQIPNDVFTVIDLLEDRGISWSSYEEGLPFSGFEGYNWVNGTTHTNSYVRKHHPPMPFNRNAESLQRLSQMKNFSMFYEDLDNHRLPQWMFITPNDLNDGHDTGITYAGNFLTEFLMPLTENEYFMKNTLILVTFDEVESYPIKNNPFSFLIGGAVPEELKGTTDNHFYDHYSDIATVEANWGLHTLGRWDVGANVFSVVAKHTGDTLRQWTKTNFDNVYLNESYAGPLSDGNSSVGWPVPCVACKHAGRTVLPEIVELWENAVNKTIYNTNVEVAWGGEPPAGYMPGEWA